MDIYKDLAISLMFSICLTTTHHYKSKWLATLSVFTDHLTCGCASYADRNLDVISGFGLA